MRILIVEDDENKGDNLSRFLGEVLPGVILDGSKSVHSAVRSIRSERPDLVLLDMTLPNFDLAPDEPGGSTKIFGGREVLRQLERFRIEVPVIVVTQFETFEKAFGVTRLTDVDSELKAEHQKNYVGLVYYHAAIHDWKLSLRKLIEQARVLNPRLGG